MGHAQRNSTSPASGYCAFGHPVYAERHSLIASDPGKTQLLEQVACDYMRRKGLPPPRDVTGTETEAESLWVRSDACCALNEVIPRGECFHRETCWPSLLPQKRPQWCRVKEATPCHTTEAVDGR